MKEIHHNSIHNAVKHLGYFHMASLKDSRYSLVLSEYLFEWFRVPQDHHSKCFPKSGWQLKVKFGIHRPEHLTLLIFGVGAFQIINFRRFLSGQRMFLASQILLQGDVPRMITNIRFPQAGSESKIRGAREPKSKPLVEKNKCVRFESLLTSLVPCLQRLHLFFHIFFSRGNQLGALQTPAQTPGNRYMKKPDVSGLNHVWVPAGNKNQPRSHKHLAFKTTFPYRKKDLDIKK